MKIFTNMNHLTGSVLAVLACASFVGCSRNNDATVMNDRNVPVETTTSASSVDTSSDTSSGTTLAANETTPATLDNTGSVPPAPADEAAMGAPASNESAAPKKAAKHSKGKHKAKKHHKAHSAAIEASPVQDAYVYDSTIDTSDEAMIGTDRDLAAVDASQDYSDEGTESGVTTNAPMSYYETGLSPFAQEPGSRIPTQIGSGQLTGEDRSTTVLDGPSLFQDPSALGRDIVH